MRVFVTGSTGLLGQNLVQRLVDDGHEVTALTRSREKFERYLGKRGVRPVQGDMRDVSAFAHELASMDAVFHTAAYFREYYGRGDHAQMLEDVNVRGTLALIAASDAARVPVFVHTSSSGAIGQKPDGSPGDEDTRPSARQLENLYFRSKHEGDQRIRAFVPKHGLRVVEIMPGWMWGPGDAGPTGAGQLLLDFAAGKLPAVPAGGATVVDARDVAAAMVRATESTHLARYIVAGRFLTLRQIVDELARALGRASPKLDLPAWLGLTYARMSEWSAALRGAERATASLEGVRIMVEAHRYSSARAERELGATFRPFAETARDAVLWYEREGFLSSRKESASRAVPAPM